MARRLLQRGRARATDQAAQPSPDVPRAFSFTHAGGENGPVQTPPRGEPDPHLNKLPAVEPVALEGLEPGRALALADFGPPPVATGERLLRMAYRLGLPASVLGNPLGRRRKPRVTATVINSVPGNAAAGTALRAGHFVVHGARTPIAQIDFAGAQRIAPPLERCVHSFSWLADLDACASRETCAPVAERILGAWLQANPKPPGKPGKGPAWTVGNTGTRLLNWLTFAPLILSGDKGFRSRALGAIADTARWLDRNVQKGEDSLAEVAGWCGIVAAGLLLPEGTPRRLYGEAGLMKALGETIGDDGGVLSRSPLGQMEAIALLVRLRNCYQATRRDPPEAMEAVIALLVPPLLALAHGDGSLGSWQGGWAVDGADVDTLVKASGVRTRPLREVRQWGYQRVLAHRSILQFDTAPPPMPGQARSGCASTLAFEFSCAGERIVVNCGGAACGGGLVPVRLEQGLRATAAHSTLTLDDANSTAVLINGLIGQGVSLVDIDRKTLHGENGTSATRLEASHNGYTARYGLTHKRILIVRDDGTELRGEDMLLPSARKGKRGRIGFAIRFHLAPGVAVGPGEDGQGASLQLPDGTLWMFRSTSGSGEVTVEDSLWVDGQGRPQATHQLVIEGLVSRGGGTFGWIFKKLG